MLNENEENSSLINNSKIEEEDSASEEEKSIEINDEVNISEEEEKTDRKSSFKPLNFPSEEKSNFDSEISFKPLSGKSDSEKIDLSADFKNSEFFYENSLLTNAEDFAKSIREGANLYKSKLLSKIEQTENDTARIHKQILYENEEAKQIREDLITVSIDLIPLK